MGLFFDVNSPLQQKLLDKYDEAVKVFRAEVSAVMDEAAKDHPAIAPLMKTCAEAVRQRPLASEANNDEAALKQLTLSSITVEMCFSKLQSFAQDQADVDAAVNVANAMREIGKATIGRPEFRPLLAGTLKAVGDMRASVLREMDERTLAMHVDALQKPARNAPASGPGAPPKP